MVPKPKLLLRAYAILSFGTIIAIYVLRPDWSAILWPFTILNGLLCAWNYRRVARAEGSRNTSH
jgi:hypothetical protein